MLCSRNSYSSCVVGPFCRITVDQGICGILEDLLKLCTGELFATIITIIDIISHNGAIILLKLACSWDFIQLTWRRSVRIRLRYEMSMIFAISTKANTCLGSFLVFNKNFNFLRKKSLFLTYLNFFVRCCQFHRWIWLICIRIGSHSSSVSRRWSCSEPEEVVKMPRTGSAGARWKSFSSLP